MLGLLIAISGGRTQGSAMGCLTGQKTGETAGPTFHEFRRIRMDTNSSGQHHFILLNSFSLSLSAGCICLRLTLVSNQCICDI